MASTIETQIDAVTLSEGIAAITSLVNSMSSAATGSSKVLITIEDIIAELDPEFIPVIGGIRKILPLLSGVLAAVAPVPPDTPASPSSPIEFSKGR